MIALLTSVTPEAAIALGNLRRRGMAVTAIVNVYDEYDFAESPARWWPSGSKSRQLRDRAAIPRMCQRLRVAIANVNGQAPLHDDGRLRGDRHVSPALVMVLVGSLVFFLIEVLYVGEYQARLMYVFALFVFAAVLIARIAIERGSEYASLFALPLGLAMFVVLVKFVEHPSPFSWLINIGLMCVVWWCAHKLTWDCTLIDDDEDASGEGLMQRIGVDEATASDAPAADNELLAEKEAARRPGGGGCSSRRRASTRRACGCSIFRSRRCRCLASDSIGFRRRTSGRRRYVFSLLLVYVASALALLVTTSFLGLRRYLRQRRVEMPAPMAANWVGIGAVLIVIVMLLAALIPRPQCRVRDLAGAVASDVAGWLVVVAVRRRAGRLGTSMIRPAARSRKTPRKATPCKKAAKGEPAESDQGKPSGKPAAKTRAMASQAAKNHPTNRSRSAQSDGKPDEQSATTIRQCERDDGSKGNRPASEDESKQDENARRQLAPRTRRCPSMRAKRSRSSCPRFHRHR